MSVLLLLAGESSGRVERDGAEFQISHLAYNGGPDVATLDGGSFIIVWTGFIADTATVDIFGRVIGPDGTPEETEFVVDDHRLDQDSVANSPNVVALEDTRIVVVWTNAAEDGDDLGVFMRILDLGPPPTPVTPEILVNTYTTGRQFLHSVVALPGGEFLISWVTAGELGLGTRRILAQRFTGGGVRVGGELEIPESGSTFRPTVPEIAGRSDGSFVATWSSDYGEDGDGLAVFARLFAANGVAIGGQFLVNTETAGNQLLQDVAVGPNDGFVVAWANEPRDGSPRTIRAQRFDQSGAKIDGAFAVNEYTSTPSNAPTLASFEDGSFVIVWYNDGQDGDSFGVIGRRFASSGEPDGTEFVVNTYTDGSQGRLSARDSVNVAALSNTSFVVVWDGESRPGYGGAVYAQRFCVLDNGTEACGDSACPPAAVSGGLTASDALRALQAAIDLTDCAPCVCDANGSGEVTAVDAAFILAASVGLAVNLTCPPCND